MISQSAFAHHQIAWRYMPQQLQRCRYISAKGMQITVVDADDATGTLEGFLQLCGGMHFDERFKPKLSTQGSQVNELWDIECSGDQQHSIGTIPPRFVELIRINDKILA